MNMKFIEELKEDMTINEIYFCRKKQELLTKAGKPYFSLTLQDKTGSLDAKVWNTGSGGIEEFSTKKYWVSCFKCGSFILAIISVNS